MWEDAALQAIGGGEAYGLKVVTFSCSLGSSKIHKYNLGFQGLSLLKLYTGQIQPFPSRLPHGPGSWIGAPSEDFFGAYPHVSFLSSLTCTYKMPSFIAQRSEHDSDGPGGKP